MIEGVDADRKSQRRAKGGHCIFGETCGGGADQFMGTSVGRRVDRIV